MTLYQKVIAVIGMLRSSIDQKTSKLDLAPLFNTSVNYPVDSLVVYKNVLYVCTTAHSGEWDVDDFATATIDDILRLKANKADFAPEYSDTASYNQNQLVIKNGAFMECTVAGYGDEAQFQNVTVAQVVARLDNAIKQAAAISQVYAILENIVPKYAVYTNYAVGNRCSYNGKLYECTDAVYASSSTPDDTFWSTYWKTITVEEMMEEMLAGYVKSGSNASLQSLTMKDSSGPAADGPTITIGTANRLLVIDKLGVTVSDETGEDAQRIYFGTSKSGTVALLEDLAPNMTTLRPDSSGKIVFKAGQMLVYGNELYLCTTGYSVDAASEDPVWVEANWTECTIDAVLDVLMDMLKEAMTPGFRNKMSTSGFVASTAISDTYVDKSSARIFFTPSGLGMDAVKVFRIRNSASAIGNPGIDMYMHICELNDGAELGEESNGTVVAVSNIQDGYYFGRWPSIGVDADYWGVIDKNYKFANPDKQHFIAFDTYSHEIGSAFGTGGLVVGFKALSSMRSVETGCFAYLQNERFCPLFSFGWNAEERRIPFSCCLEELDANSQVGGATAFPVSLPSISSLPDVTEIRLVVAVGAGGPLSLHMDTTEDEFVLLSGPTQWMLLTEKAYNVFVFRSLGRRLSTNSDSQVVLKRLWAVDAPPTPASSEYNLWLGSVSTDWTTASNWSLGVVPGAASSVRFGGGIYSVYLPSIQHVSSLHVAGSVLISSSAGGRVELRTSFIEGSGTLKLSGITIKSYNTSQMEVSPSIEFVASSLGIGLAANPSSSHPVVFKGNVSFAGGLTVTAWNTMFTFSGDTTFLGDVSFVINDSSTGIAFGNVVVDADVVMTLTTENIDKLTFNGTITVNSGGQITLPKKTTDYTLGSHTVIGSETDTTVTLVYQGASVVSHSQSLLSVAAVDADDEGNG